MAYLLMIVDAYVQEVQLYSNTYKDHIHFYHWGNMFRKALYELLSDPTFIPPEELFELKTDLEPGWKPKSNDKESNEVYSQDTFRLFLQQFSDEVLIKFSIGEAKLVLPIYEDYYQDDTGPRMAIQAVEKCSMDVDGIETGFYKTFRFSERPHHLIGKEGKEECAFDAINAAVGAAAAISHISVVDYSEYAAYAASLADDDITMKDQLKRLLEIFKEG